MAISKSVGLSSAARRTVDSKKRGGVVGRRFQFFYCPIDMTGPENISNRNPPDQKR